MYRYARSLIVILFVSAIWAARPAHAVDLVYFDTPDSAVLFEEAQLKDDFWPLVRRFVSEHHLTFCGVASSVAVLNALDVTPPLTHNIYPYAVFDQENFFTDAIVEIKAPQAVLAEGLVLSQVAEMLRTHSVMVDVHYADAVTVDEFRDLAIKALSDPSQMIIVNYAREGLGQPGGGHISPLAAYHEASDRVLMLDVARYKLPPAWVKVDDFLAAMNTIDSSSNESRGFLIVTKP